MSSFPTLDRRPGETTQQWADRLLAADRAARAIEAQPPRRPLTLRYGAAR